VFNTSDSQAKAIWAAIVAALTDEMNVGPNGKPGSGTNTSGRLQSAQYVHKTIHLWSDELPLVGVQLVDEPRGPWAQHFQETDLHFRIAVAANSTTPNPTTGQVMLDDAYDALMNLLQDGNGNGVVPILCDQNNVRWGGNAIFSFIKRIQYDWDVDKAVGTTDARAYAYITYIVQTQTTY
jgi:hypothetical protein